MATVVDKWAYFDKVGYRPHSEEQAAYHRSQARFRIACAGRRFGKSRMASVDAEPEFLLGNRRFWIVGPTYNLGEKEFRYVWNDMVVNLKLGRDKRMKKAYNLRTGEMWLEFPWGTRVEVRSATHPEGLVGDALHGVIMSEAAKHKAETWERFIRPALSDYHGWATFPSTPEGHNWFWDLFQIGQDPDPDLKDYASWRFPSWANPVVYPGGRDDSEILTIEKTTSHEWFMQEIGADFSTFVGRIYSEFDETVHLKRHEYNPAWPNYMAFDWGFVNPLAAIEFQVDPMDNIYVWREHYEPLLTLDEHFDIMRNRPQPDGYKIDCCFGDAADPEATMQVNLKFGPCISLPEAKTNWREGVDLVKFFLREWPTGRELDEYGTPELAPKLFLDFRCKHTIFEMSQYRSKDDPLSNLRESGSASAAIKMDDHTMDALRYGLMHVFKLGAKASNFARAVRETHVLPVEIAERDPVLPRDDRNNDATFFSFDTDRSYTFFSMDMDRF